MSLIHHLMLSQKAENFIFGLFKDKVSEVYLYHNFQHIFRVVQSADLLGKAHHLSEEELEILTLAAWFHDSGYSDSEENHEENSAKIAEEFLKTEGFPEDKIKEVQRIILATTHGHEPVDLLEKIIRDADTSHFAEENYPAISELLRAEWELTENKIYTDEEWASLNRNHLLKEHRYYTDFARENWSKAKNENVAVLQKKIQKINSGEGGKSKGKEPKDERFSRAIDTMFRVTLNNHTRLSEIADSKANILLSVNAIIISIILGTLIPKLDATKNFHLILPTFVLMISSVVTIIFAIMSTRPKVTEGTFSREEIEKKQVNLLFFGNFHKMPISEYEWAMNDLMKDREALYNALTRDLYYLGLVLNRKYYLLRITYGIFTIGIILSVITFVWAFLKFNIGFENL